MRDEDIPADAADTDHPVGFAASWRRYREGLPPVLAQLMPEQPPGQRPDDVDEVAVGESRSLGRAELLAVLHQQVQLAQVSHRLRPEAASRGLVATAWRRVVYRQVKAVLALFEAGHADEAQPNARAALEHATFLQALAAAESDGMGQAFQRAAVAEQDKHAGSAVTRLQEIDQDSGQQMREVLDAMTQVLTERAAPTHPPHPRLGRVATVFHLAGKRSSDFYDTYARLSEGSHAGMTSAMPHLAVGPGARLAPVLWADVLLVLVWSCWAADDAVDEFLLDPHLAERHLLLTEPLGFSPGHRPRS